MGEPTFPKEQFAPQREISTPKAKGGLNIDKIIKDDFSKKKNLKKAGDKWTLPHPDQLFTSHIWQNKHMMRSKTELNEVKNRLSGYVMKDWHQHTRLTNHAGSVVNTVKNIISPELITQAWCKFQEIVSTYNLVPHDIYMDNSLLNSLHLCEAPGAFITSLNHFLKLKNPHINWNWRASTLNPYYEGNELSFMINDDRFILHTLDSWEFGRDQTGDMFQQDNIDRLIAVSQQISPVHLVTADGSIDCQSDPGEQEAIVSRLHYYETLIALSVLSQGGSFLLKIFTMFECQTICLLYVLSCVFQTVDLLKPATSKEGNSEVYVVCLKFSGPASVERHLDVLRNGAACLTDKAIVSDDQIPLDFILKISECSDFFKALQVSILERNIRTFEEHLSDDEQSTYRWLKKKLAHSYLKNCCLKPLPLPHYYLVESIVVTQS